ncbi:UPF0280 family protein [Shimia sp.]|uniref:UPF0280 family protein n=1 Tax=Shimia sp. TaxID=1954381 RepID=UPI003B8BA642
MSGWAQIQWLPDGSRLHLQHGPIDLLVEVWGPGRSEAYDRASARFETILQEMVDELDMLRLPACADVVFRGVVAREMQRAAQQALPEFVTPMAAVAGAVADEIARVIASGDGVLRAYVNNGGDAALVLADGQVLTSAVAGADAKIAIHAADPIRGVATSGWRGRSLSFGVADSVTVLSKTAAQADVAATLIANHVDLPNHPEVCKRPAHAVRDDSELGDRLVTVHVGNLSDADAGRALESGVHYARSLMKRSPIAGVFLTLAGQWRCLGKMVQVAPDARPEWRSKTLLSEDI